MTLLAVPASGESPLVVSLRNYWSRLRLLLFLLLSFVLASASSPVAMLSVPNPLHSAHHLCLPELDHLEWEFATNKRDFAHVEIQRMHQHA